MLGLILCAGRGTRLANELVEMPKCMVDVGGKPILEYIANYLEKQGIQRIVINLHSWPSKVMEYFCQRFLYLYEPIPMGEYHTVNLLRGWFPSEEIMVVNGDTLITKKETGVKHCGITVYRKDGSAERLLDNEFIDVGTQKGLEEAREYVKH